MLIKEKNSVRFIAGMVFSATFSMQLFAQESTAEIEALKQRLDQLEQKQKMFDGMGTAKTNPVKFTGFLSVGLSQLSEDTDAVYGSGQEDDLSLLPTTYAGIQMNVDLYESGEFVYQVVAKGNNEEDAFDLDTEWLYLKQDLGAGFNTQIGRIRFPAFMDSETYYVGTTYPWITPPSEIYESLPLTNIDGISINHVALFGEWELNTKILLWGDAAEGSDAYKLVLDDMYGISLSLSYDTVNIRLAYMAAEEEIRIDSEPNGFLLEDMKETFGDDLEYLIASARYDDGMFYVSAEVVDIDADKGVLDENRNWNITFGGYIGPVMLYIGQSEIKVTNEDEIAGVINDEFNFQMVSTAYGPIPIGNVFAPYLNRQQQTRTIGMKYDFMPNAALKIQIQKLEDFNNTAGNFSGGAQLDFEDIYVYDIAVQASF